MFLKSRRLLLPTYQGRQKAQFTLTHTSPEGNGMSGIRPGYRDRHGAEVLPAGDKTRVFFLLFCLIFVDVQILYRHSCGCRFSVIASLQVGHGHTQDSTAE